VRLPLTDAEFYEFKKTIFSEYEIEDTKDNTFGLARMVQMLDPTVLYAPKKYFAFSLKKQQANQAAFEVMEKIREEAKAEAKEKEASAEATPVESVTLN